MPSSVPVHVLTRDGLIREVSRACELSLRDSKSVVETIVSSMVRDLAAGGRIEIRGFGAFSAKARPARKGVSPVTGEPLEIPAKRTARFKPARQLLESIQAPASAGGSVE